MAEVPVSELLDIAIKASQVGGKHALANKARCEEYIAADRHDIKLALDVECQAKIEAFIRQSFPEHAILGEEDNTSLNGNRLGDDKSNIKGPDGYEWIIDPIDGTVNFSHKFPIWCCSVAVRRGETVQAGAVYAPDMNILYAASVDTPSTRNGEPIQVTKRDKLAESIILTGLDKNVVPGVEPLGFFFRFAENCRKARILGSAALDLCLVAEGIADGYFEGSIYLWDIAAAGLIVKQAGGKGEIIAEREEPNQISYLASNGLIQEKLKDLITAL